jgi:hypothetical protein
LRKRTENDGATPPGRSLVNQQMLPSGCDAVTVGKVIRHYEEQTEDEAITDEDEGDPRIVESDPEANK